ncbi:5-formyltetrahydrofolate cyclo-ligase [Desulfobacterota bacterium M19]
MPAAKEDVRQTLAGIPANPAQHGRLAQELRRLTEYNRAANLFITPAPILSQIRINALIDGKKVIMPAAGLREGFYLLTPYTIPFPKLTLAVSLKGLSSFGRRLHYHDLEDLKIDLLITEALAVSEKGERLGGGDGFFDLSCAALSASHALNVSPEICAVIDNKSRFVKSLPTAPWDVPINILLSPSGSQALYKGFQAPDLDWRQIPPKRIKRLTPLWDIKRQKPPSASPEPAAACHCRE